MTDKKVKLQQKNPNPTINHHHHHQQHNFFYVRWDCAQMGGPRNIIHIEMVVRSVVHEFWVQKSMAFMTFKNCKMILSIM
jgi:hypothetical protein